MNKITPQATVRLIIYVVGALAGLAAAVLAALGHTDHTALLTSIAGAAAVITGGTAAYNIEKTPATASSVGEVLGALQAVVREAKALNKPDYVGEHRTPDAFSVYHEEV